MNNNQTNMEGIFGEMEERSKLESDFLSLKVGKNPIRIISDFFKVENIFKGKFPNSKYQGIKTPERVLAVDETITTQGWVWVIDRTTNELKIAQFGKNIIGQIMTYKNDPEYAFAGFPMPYDLNINNTGEGASRYTVTPARTNTEITAEEMAQLNKKKTIKDIVGAIIDKQNRPADYAPTEKVAYPTEEISIDEMVF